MNDGFLPQGYEIPKGNSDYMKLKAGPNKFRILSAPILGFEYWTTERKPVRARELWRIIPVDADISGANGWSPKHFWAMVVWNFEDKAIQILELTQKSIQQVLQEYIHNEDWGDPRDYNITITRKGEKLDTEYNVMASPKSAVPADLKRIYEEKNINLEALYEGGNPFDATERSASLDGHSFPTNTAEAREASHEYDAEPGDIGF